MINICVLYLGSRGQRYDFWRKIAAVTLVNVSNIMLNKTSSSHSTEAITEFRRSVTRLGRLLAASMPKGELSPMKLSALSILGREGSFSASALASRLGILPQSLTRILADLASEDLLTRHRDERDAREHILEPTAKARSLMRTEGARRDAILREAMQRALTPIEIEVLLVAGKAINKLADAWAAPTASMPGNEEASE
jgi:DNA-binding MarR family transcriptional regulator